MQLEHVEVTGFRGINQLSLPLEGDNVLIGENAWGKSSLLDALTLLLSPETPDYQFTLHDFHFTPGEQHTRLTHLQVVFTFRESEVDERFLPRLKGLEACWQRAEQGLYRLRYHLRGDRDAQDQVTTQRQFIDLRGEVLSGIEVVPAVKTLIRLHPVLRLRDARFNRHFRLQGEQRPTADLSGLVNRIDTLTRDMVARPQNLTDQALRQGLHTMQQLLQHYFALQHPPEERALSQRSVPGRASAQGWRYLDTLNQTIASADSRSRRLILLRMFSLLIQARGHFHLHPQARPLLLIEDPETRLHPIMLSVAWGLLTLLPLQKITTTNSGELLSQVPITHVCRLVREASHVAAWRLGPEGMNSEDSRRIAFHIRFNRPSSLFARCWLLVEGETEVWVMNELARQCGYHFEAEGIKVIEFAQSGLKPLLKFAYRMGIEWHVLTDGDQAGKKYAETARGLLRHGDNPERHHLTVLPALDMEHFLYREGFSDVFHRMAQLPDNVPMNTRRIITKAIHRTSKPDLAIAVATVAAERGTEAIPVVLRKMFARVLWLARGKAD
ncbi:ATP-dependent endonuclease [Enterobacterales bacterium CwR94]|nr:ATP-dependent endonuclease [Enterobacterales bacterium CwR94]